MTGLRGCALSRGQEPPAELPQPPHPLAGPGETELAEPDRPDPHAPTTETAEPEPSAEAPAEPAESDVDLALVPRSGFRTWRIEGEVPAALTDCMDL